MGLPIDGDLDFGPVAGESNITLVSLPEYTELAMKQHPEIQSAIEAVERARQGVRLRRRSTSPTSAYLGSIPIRMAFRFWCITMPHLVCG